MARRIHRRSVPHRPSKRIDPEGPLALFRNLTRVPQKLHQDPTWEDECFTPDRPDPLKWFPEVAAETPINRYLGWSQNDAFVNECRLKDRNYVLSLNHYDVHRLATVFDEDISWYRRRKDFPVTIEFQDARVEIVRVVEQGAVQKVRSSAANLSGRLCDIRTIRCIAASAEMYTFLVVVRGMTGFRRGKREFANPYEDCYYIAVTCRNVILIEGYREGWLAKLGEEKLPILTKFDKVWPVPGWAMHDFEAWVDEHFPNENAR